MIKRNELERLAHRISRIRNELEALREDGQGFNCIEKNVMRALASVKMLELEINDVAEYAEG